MHIFRKQALCLLIVSIWLAFAPGLFELQRLYANDSLPIQEAETTEGELSDLSSILDELITTRDAIEQFNQAVFHNGEIEAEDVVKNADAMVAQLILKVYVEADDEVTEELNNFYQALSDNLLGVGEAVFNTIQQNKSYSGYLSTIFTWGRWIGRGHRRLVELQKVSVNIAGSMIKALAKLGDVNSLPNRRVLIPIRHMLQSAGSRFPLLRRGMERFAAAAPNISGALENANKYLGPIGFLLNIQSFASNQDVHAGIFNYDTLNSGIGVLLSGAGIVCSFFPPASIVLATVGLIYFGAKFTVEMIASHFEKRMEAYKASYDFLMATDPNFPVDAQKFREKDGLESEREILNKYYLLNREKLTSVLLADSDALENRFAPNDVNFRRILDRCKAIWSAKADILGSRRNWQNSSEYYFSSLLDYILPRETRKNHAEQISLFELFVPGYGRDRDERRARTSELEVALDDFHPLVANPDFALIVLFDNYVEYGRHEADANKIEFLRSRIKKNPFLFPYMLEIPQMQYNDEIFEQAIAVDSVNAGWLEVSNLTEILEKMEDKISFNMLEEDGIVRALATLFYEAKKMSCCTRYLSNVADLLAEDEESKIDVRQGTHVEIDSSTDLNSARQIMNYLDEFTDEDLVAALDGESEIEAKDLFELSAFQDAVKNLIANAAMVNANFFASMQKAETVASQNELVFARLSQLLSQAKKSLDLADKFVKDSRIKEFYAKGKYLGEKEGGILGFVSGHVPLRERYEEELARFEHVVENIGKKFFRFRQYIVPREKAEAILDNLRVQLQDNGADLPDGFSMGGGSIIINDRVEKVVEYQQQLKKLIEKTESIDNLESPIELNGELAENIYLSSDFELCEYSVKAMFPSLESEN